MLQKLCKNRCGKWISWKNEYQFFEVETGDRHLYPNYRQISTSTSTNSTDSREHIQIPWWYRRMDQKLTEILDTLGRIEGRPQDHNLTPESNTFCSSHPETIWSPCIGV